MYTRFQGEAQDFFYDLGMSTYVSNVVEDAILRIAGSNNKATQCFFGPDGEDESRIVFKYQGISEQDNTLLSDYFFKTCGNHFGMAYTPAPGENRNEDIFKFTLPSEAVYEKIFPEIKKEILNLIENKSELIDQYRQQASDDQFLQLNLTVKDLIRLAQELELNCNHPYTKGQLNVYLGDLIKHISAYEEHHKDRHNCGAGESFAIYDMQRTHQFLNENEYVKESETAKKLNERIDQYGTFVDARRQGRRLAENMRLFQTLQAAAAKPEAQEEENVEKRSCRLM